MRGVIRRRPCCTVGYCRCDPGDNRFLRRACGGAGAVTAGAWGAATTPLDRRARARGARDAWAAGWGVKTEHDGPHAPRPVRVRCPI